MNSVMIANGDKFCLNCRNILSVNHECNCGGEDGYKLIFKKNIRGLKWKLQKWS